ncbi:MAG: efflux RND transporter periplasmic adaptor subunit [Proteobacteria bacterium]|nr:efflux RND transporter periplasmic adaptor subunit [Pseudomonadota bacterium]
MNTSMKIALGMTVLAVLWMVSGVFTPKDKEVEHTVKKAESGVSALVSVKTEDLRAQAYIPSVTVNGRTEASKSVTVRAEIDGRVLELLVDRGSIVKKGQVLARIDLRDRRERVTETEQKLKQAEVEYEAASVLQSEGFNSKIRLAQKKAELETARAQLKLARTDLANTEVKAPFDGIVSDRAIEAGDYVKGGDALATVVTLNPLKIRGYMSETDIIHAKVGAVASVTLPDNKTLEGIITFVAPVAEERSRTFPVELEAANEAGVIAGLTASISIPLEAMPAYQIKSSSLALDDKGRVGIKAVGTDNVVQFFPVRVLSDAGSTIWIGGSLPETMRLITVGQAFVAAGQSIQ